MHKFTPLQVQQLAYLHQQWQQMQQMQQMQQLHDLQVHTTPTKLATSCTNQAVEQHLPPVSPEPVGPIGPVGSAGPAGPPNDMFVPPQPLSRSESEFDVSIFFKSDIDVCEDSMGTSTDSSSKPEVYKLANNDALYSVPHEIEKTSTAAGNVDDDKTMPPWLILRIQDLESIEEIKRVSRSSSANYRQVTECISLLCNYKDYTIVETPRLKSHLVMMLHKFKCISNMLFDQWKASKLEKVDRLAFLCSTPGCLNTSLLPCPNEKADYSLAILRCSRMTGEHLPLRCESCWAFT